MDDTRLHGYAEELNRGDRGDKLGGRREKRGGNRKGRDFGYALAARSCEGAYDVESCTITAFDAITAFAVPNPGHILAE
ncbi:MAG: hypothetical protein ACRD3L_06410 [Terriglobales bacterium]